MVEEKRRSSPSTTRTSTSGCSRKSSCGPRIGRNSWRTREPPPPRPSLRRQCHQCRNAPDAPDAPNAAANAASAATAALTHHPHNSARYSLSLLKRSATFKEDACFHIQSHCDSLRSQIRHLKDDIQCTSVELEWILTTLVGVAGVLIVAPLLGLYIANSDGEDVHWHYYFRDLFNIAFGVCAVTVAIFLTARLTGVCDECLVTICEIPLDQQRSAAEEGQGGLGDWRYTQLEYLQNYVQSIHFAPVFGFSMVGHRVVYDDLSRFASQMFALVLFIIMDAL